MTSLLPLSALAAGLAAALASLGIWAPRRLAPKLAALALTACFLPTAYAALADLLGRPKPAALEWWLGRAGEATVLGSSIEEGKALHLWLRLEGVPEPRAYVLPWDRRLAEQLQAASRAAEAQGSAVRMRLPFEPSLDDREPRFHAPPQPALPPKESPAPAGA